VSAPDAEALFEDAPCGYLATELDGMIVRVNRTFEALTGFSRAELVAERRFQQLLAPGARIYHETHYAPLLRMQGAVSEIALELVCADGTRLPALVNATVHDGIVRTVVFAASDRRSYEQELVAERRREREIAQRLQASLLAGALPSRPGVDVGVAYRPGVSTLEVGGDWYDAFVLPDGETIALAVGDVVGRGLDAAAAMGQLRSALRALAASSAGPARVLLALDAYAARHGVGRMTTVVYAELDPAVRTLRFACAGHPPPLIFGPDGQAGFDWGGRSLPLDAVRTPRPRDEASVVVPAGGGVLLYSDGLIERRSRPLSDGFDALAAVVGGLPSGDAAGLARAISAALGAPEADDDACVLVALARR
jgi:sigma-B regulation protein RsbU (phosphoserine phosphatase)